MPATQPLARASLGITPAELPPREPRAKRIRDLLDHAVAAKLK